jgi:hypothetical protein
VLAYLCPSVVCARSQKLTGLVALFVPSVKPAATPASHIRVQYKVKSDASAAQATESSPANFDELADRIKAMVQQMSAAHLKHFELEEGHIAVVAKKYLSREHTRV